MVEVAAVDTKEEEEEEEEMVAEFATLVDTTFIVGAMVPATIKATIAKEQEMDTKMRLRFPTR